MMIAGCDWTWVLAGLSINSLDVLWLTRRLCTHTPSPDPENGFVGFLKWVASQENSNSYRDALLPFIDAHHAVTNKNSSKARHPSSKYALRTVLLPSLLTIIWSRFQTILVFFFFFKVVTQLTHFYFAFVLLIFSIVPFLHIFCHFAFHFLFLGGCRSTVEGSCSF